MLLTAERFQAKSALEHFRVVYARLAEVAAMGEHEDDAGMCDEIACDQPFFSCLDVLKPSSLWSSPREFQESCARLFMLSCADAPALDGFQERSSIIQCVLRLIDDGGARIC